MPTLPTLNQAALAGTIATATFIAFDRIYMDANARTTKEKIAFFLSKGGALATICTASITVAAVVSKKWLLLSLVGGAICSGLSAIEKLRNSDEQDHLETMSTISEMTGAAINFIATSYLLYRQPSAPRALLWSTIPLSLVFSLRPT